MTTNRYIENEERELTDTCILNRRLFSMRGGLLFELIDTYITDFICDVYLRDEYRGNWKDDLIGNSIEEFIDNIIQNTINNEGYNTENLEFFKLPRFPNAHGLLLQYIRIKGREVQGDDFRFTDNCMFYGDWACLTYAYFWLDSHRGWLKYRLDEYRERYIRLGMHSRDSEDEDEETPEHQ
jgi:hypothetical protein